MSSQESLPYKYEEVLDTDSNTTACPSSPFLSASNFFPRPTKSSRRNTYILALITVGLLIILGLTNSASYLFGRHQTLKKDQNVKHPDTNLSRPSISCGTTSAEAEARGCIFDPLVVSWIPAECSRVGSEEFLAASPSDNPWTYYYDPEGKRKIPGWEALSHLGNGNFYYSTGREHIVHCNWILVRGFRARRSGDRVDSLTTNMRHAEHCSQYLLKMIGASDEELDKVEGTSNVGILNC